MNFLDMSFLDMTFFFVQVFFALCAAALIIFLVLAAICAVVGLAYLAFTIVKIICESSTQEGTALIDKSEKSTIKIMFKHWWRNDVYLIIFSCLLLLLVEALPMGCILFEICWWLLLFIIPYMVLSFFYYVSQGAVSEKITATENVINNKNEEDPFTSRYYPD
ncbi:MAG: hypothetical protein WC192_00315 [Candidatus Babeliales bacterium]|jgi:hypothetical protein